MNNYSSDFTKFAVKMEHGPQKNHLVIRIELTLGLGFFSMRKKGVLPPCNNQKT